MEGWAFNLQYFSPLSQSSNMRIPLERFAEVDLLLPSAQDCHPPCLLMPDLWARAQGAGLSDYILFVYRLFFLWIPNRTFLCRHRRIRSLRGVSAPLPFDVHCASCFLTPGYLFPRCVAIPLFPPGVRSPGVTAGCPPHTRSPFSSLVAGPRDLVRSQLRRTGRFLSETPLSRDGFYSVVVSASGFPWENPPFPFLTIFL